MLYFHNSYYMYLITLHELLEETIRAFEKVYTCNNQLRIRSNKKLPAPPDKKLCPWTPLGTHRHSSKTQIISPTCPPNLGCLHKTQLAAVQSSLLAMTAATYAFV